MCSFISMNLLNIYFNIFVRLYSNFIWDGFLCWVYCCCSWKYIYFELLLWISLLLSLPLCSPLLLLWLYCCFCPDPQAKIRFYNISLESSLPVDLAILRICSSSQLMTCFSSHSRSCAYCFLCLGLKLRIYYTKQQIQQWFSICLFGGELHPKSSLDQWMWLQSSTLHCIFFVPVSLQKAHSSHQFLFLDLESSRACDVSLLLLIHGDLSYIWVWQVFFGFLS